MMCGNNQISLPVPQKGDIAISRLCDWPALCSAFSMNDEVDGSNPVSVKIKHCRVGVFLAWIETA